jgi:predicted nucleotidyltransferase
MVTFADIAALAGRIADEYRPARIILFGSHAAGCARRDSDVDLLVLMPNPKGSFQTALDILNRLEPRFGVDLVVRSPEDAELRYRFGDPLIREAFDRGRVLYEAAA